jgi:hypothetical protein
VPEADKAHDRSPHSCPRCGAPPREPCGPIRSTDARATIEGFHAERALSPVELRKRGYLPYTLVEPHTGLTLQLWRRATQQPLRRNGFQLDAPPNSSPRHS